MATKTKNIKNTKTKKLKAAVITRRHQLDKDAEIEALKDRITELEDELEGALDERLDLEIRIENLEDELANAEEENSRLQNDVEDISRERSEAEEEAAASAARECELEEENDRLLREVDDLTEEIKSLRKRIRKLNEEADEEEKVFSVYYSLPGIEDELWNSYSDKASALSVAASLIDPNALNHIDGITSVEVREEAKF